MSSQFKILGLDPGKSTGWAMILAETGKHIDLIKMGVTKDMELVDINQYIQDADYIVYEDWKTRPKNAKKGAFDWNPMEAPRVIGSARTLFRLTGKPLAQLVSQQAAQKVPGYGLAGLKYVPGKKGMHAQDALAHAVLFGVRKFSALPPKRGAS